MSGPVSAWAMAWSRFRAACELLGYRQGKFCLILAAAQPHRPQNRELTRQIFQGCHFPLGEPGLPGLSSLEWMSEWVLYCRRDWENRLHERFFHLGRKKKNHWLFCLECLEPDTSLVFLHWTSKCHTVQVADTMSHYWLDSPLTRPPFPKQTPYILKVRAPDSFLHSHHMVFALA